ncbi:MAG: signal peptide peptidase SppA [Candidatus Eisenbacteria bacterium]|nr:signal peptide peptidase SppA [Candidatus Eisenbacteria bacterium]
MTRRTALWIWIIAVVGLLLVFLLTLVAIESILGRHVSFPAYGARVGLVRVEGLLTDSRMIIEDLRFMEEIGVSSLVLRVDSPGGGVAASQEIYEYVRRMKETGLPVVVSMGAVAASGGYYVSCPADSIIANPGTLTGSIGVIMSFTNLQELFGKIGVDFERVKSGRYKDIGTWDREMTEEERRLLQETVDDIHAQFVETVAAGRGMEIARVESLADGRIFSGRQALEAGLVDGLGTLEEAIATAGRMAGIRGEPQVQEPVRPGRLTLFDLLTGKLSEFLGPASSTGGALYLYNPAK